MRRTFKAICLALMMAVLLCTAAYAVELESLPEQDGTEAAEPEALPEQDAPETAEPEALPEQDAPETAEPEALPEQDAPEAAEPEALPEQDAPEAAELENLPEPDASGEDGEEGIFQCGADSGPQTIPGQADLLENSWEKQVEEVLIAKWEEG